jgi:hypothetical protein
MVSSDELERPLRTNSSGTALLFAAAPIAVPLALAVAIALLEAIVGGPLAISLRGAAWVIVSPSIIISALGAVLLYNGPSRWPSRVAAVVAVVFFVFADFWALLLAGLATCGNEDPPPSGSSIAKFCNGPAVGHWELALLNVFPILITGYFLRRRRPRNWPFAAAIAVACATWIGLIALLPH